MASARTFLADVPGARPLPPIVGPLGHDVTLYASGSYPTGTLGGVELSTTDKPAMPEGLSFVTALAKSTLTDWLLVVAVTNESRPATKTRWEIAPDRT